MEINYPNKYLPVTIYMSVHDKKEKEQKVASFFANQYKDLPLLIEDTEDREGDYILEFADRSIKIQIVTCDHEAIPTIARSEKHPWEVFEINRDPINSIVSKIKEKSWHYESGLLEKMFLLVWSENIPINEDYLIRETKEVCEDSKYKSIFFIKLPDYNQESLIDNHDPKKWSKETIFPKNTWEIIQLK